MDSEYWFDLAAAGSTARTRQLVLFHTEGQAYRLESEEHSIVADIGLEVVVVADTVPEVVVVGVAGIVPEAVVDIAPVVVVAVDIVLELVVVADTALELVVTADTVAVSQRSGSDMAPAVYPPTTDQFCNPYLMPSHKILAESSIPSI